MTKLSLMADLHLRANEPYDGVEHSRLVEKLSALKTVVSYAVDHSHDYLILAGDIFDSRDPPEWLRARFVQELGPCFGADIPVFILVGNHETNGVNTVFDTMRTVEDIVSETGTDWPIHIIDQPETVNTKDVTINLVPYCKPEVAIEAVTSWRGLNRKGVPKVLIGHFSVDGAETTGSSAYKIPTILRRHHFDGYDLTFLGHIHQRQIHKNASGEGYWTYVGSPVYQDFGERDDTYPKGFYEISFGTNGDGEQVAEFNTVPIDSTQFVQVEITEEMFSDFPLGDTKPKTSLILIKQRKACKGKICKVLFSGSESWLKGQQVQEIRKKFRGFEKSGYSAKIICDTRCTDRQVTKDAVEAVPDVELDDSMEHLCKEKDAESFLPEGQILMEEARNAVAQS